MTPTADEDSIKVDGKGAATITDMTVDLVTNGVAYEDIYPSDDEDDEDDDEDDSGSDSELENETTKTLEKEKQELEDEMQKFNAKCTAARGKLTMLQMYAKSIETDRPTDFAETLQLYEDEGVDAESIVYTATNICRDLSKKRDKVKNKLVKARNELQKEKAKKDKWKRKAAEKKERERQEKQAAKRRLQAERLEFWPKKIYCIVVSLDAALDTPGSSRRGSVESLPAMKTAATHSDLYQVSLSLSYITHSAYWTPRYDLSLSSLNQNGTILYRSEYCNTTSETWKDARVTLSTSEAAFSGIWQQVPTMLPWTVQLGKKNQDLDSSGALLSAQEQYNHQQTATFRSIKANQPRQNLFAGKSDYYGANNNSNTFGAKKMAKQAPLPRAARAAGGVGFGSSNNFGGFASNTGGGRFGSNTAHNYYMPPQAPGGSLFGANSNTTNAQAGFGASAVASEERYENDEEEAADDDRTMLPDLPTLTTEEATWAEEGLTFSYEIPGLRTIVPSFTRRRFRVATISLKNAVLSYVMVPKLRAAAFLKARIVNNSSVTLLRGLVGVTLDGSFLGNTTLPRCSAGEPFSLSLGIDPSVTVTYAKPAVKRASTGLFQKDDTATYTRTCTITNTKPNRPVEGILLDQIPVSQDERLRTTILRPGNGGLSEEGHTRSDGKGVGRDGKEFASGSEEGKKWGKATVMLKARGEVRWSFRVEATKTARFVLEYETKCPSGEKVVGAA